MKFLLIHIDASQTVELKWISIKGEEVTGAYQIKIDNDPPAPEFITALRGLNKHVAKLLDIPDKSKGIEVRKVHFKYDLSAQSTELIFSVLYNYSTGQTALNTSKILDSQLDNKFIASLRVLKDEAAKYAEGYRKQGNLFFEPSSDNWPDFINKNLDELKESLADKDPEELQHIYDGLKNVSKNEQYDKKKIKTMMNYIRSLISEKESASAAGS